MYKIVNLTRKTLQFSPEFILPPDKELKINSDKITAEIMIRMNAYENVHFINVFIYPDEEPVVTEEVKEETNTIIDVVEPTPVKEVVNEEKEPQVKKTTAKKRTTTKKTKSE